MADTSSIIPIGHANDLRKQGDYQAAVTTRPAKRLPGIDLLRGLVMVLMALDHVRDFFHREAVSFSPTDLSRTDPQLFLTRWITHFCLPVFMFCAGIGIFLRHRRAEGNVGTTRYLLTRGIWFVVLELSIMQFAYNFNLNEDHVVLLLILWIFGICMMAMAALIHLPFRVLLALSLAMIAFHNLLDRLDATRLGSFVWVWKLIHQPGLISIGLHQLLVTYTLLPWLGVMAAGFCFG